MFVTTITVKGS